MAMQEKAYAEQPQSKEQHDIERLQEAFKRMENLVGALCNTNFLTQHEDGDEEAREAAVEAVNVYSRQFVEKFKANKAIEELKQQKAAIDQKIQSIKWGGLRSITGSFTTAEYHHQTLGQTIATIPEVGRISDSKIDALMKVMNDRQAEMNQTIAINNGSK